MIHYIKIRRFYANYHLNGLKDWEVRENDCNYQVGDYILFAVIDSDGNEIGVEYTRRISYLYKSEEYGLKKGYCIISFKKTES